MQANFSAENSSLWDRMWNSDLEQPPIASNEVIIGIFTGAVLFAGIGAFIGGQIGTAVGFGFGAVPGAVVGAFLGCLIGLVIGLIASRILYHRSEADSLTVESFADNF